MDDWGYIPLSQLSQAGYCLRRAALLVNEQIWSESADTAKGRAEHERTHTRRTERRGNSVSIFEYDVFSDKLSINGKCDCVEAEASENGCHIPAVDFPVKLYPVEYKHGKLRDEREYEIQLCAQAMCLEEMYGTEIPEGAIYYITSHRRQTVKLDEKLRTEVVELIAEYDRMRKSFTVPAAEYGSKCKRCSIKELCMPETVLSAKEYCKRLAKEAKEAEQF